MEQNIKHPPVGEPAAQVENKDGAIVEDKDWRQRLDVILQEMKEAGRKSRHRSLSITHLEDSIMRLGMDLKDIGTPTPYPNSYNPKNTIVDATADGLKL